MINNGVAPFGLKQLLHNGLVKIAVLDQRARAARMQNFNERARRAKEDWKAGRITPQQYRDHINSLVNEAAEMGINAIPRVLNKNMALSRTGAYPIEQIRNAGNGAQYSMPGAPVSFQSQLQQNSPKGTYNKAPQMPPPNREGVTFPIEQIRNAGNGMQYSMPGAPVSFQSQLQQNSPKGTYNQAPGAGLPPTNLASSMQPSREDLGRRLNKAPQTAANVAQPSLLGAQEVDIPSVAPPVTIPSSFMQPGNAATAPTRMAQAPQPASQPTARRPSTVAASPSRPMQPLGPAAPNKPAIAGLRNNMLAPTPVQAAQPSANKAVWPAQYGEGYAGKPITYDTLNTMYQNIGDTGRNAQQKMQRWADLKQLAWNNGFGDWKEIGQQARNRFMKADAANAPAQNRVASTTAGPGLGSGATTAMRYANRPSNPSYGGSSSPTATAQYSPKPMQRSKGV